LGRKGAPGGGGRKRGGGSRGGAGRGRRGGGREGVTAAFGMTDQKLLGLAADNPQACWWLETRGRGGRGRGREGVGRGMEGVSWMRRVSGQ
jgi:hypothetical protein